MYILSFFTSSSIPKTGLVPIVDVREVPLGTLVVNSQSMSELGGGFYYYNFTTFDYTKDYAIVCDGSDVLSDSERYVFAGNESFIEDIADAVWDESVSGHTSNETFGLQSQEIAGLVHSNILIDNPLYDSNNNLTSARVRIYSTSLSVGTDNNVLATYTITAAGDGSGKFITWKSVKGI